MEDLKITISRKATEKGLEIGTKVFRDKEKFQDKWTAPPYVALQADIFGFVAECAVCEHFGQPMPELTEGTVDDYDIKLKGMRIDVKTTGYVRGLRKGKLAINMKQFYRKRRKIDAFLFTSLVGTFRPMASGFGADKVFVPEGGKCKLWLIGWVKTENVEKAGRKHTYPNGTEAFVFTEGSLKPVRELM